MASFITAYVFGRQHGTVTTGARSVMQNDVLEYIVDRMDDTGFSICTPEMDLSLYDSTLAHVIISEWIHEKPERNTLITSYFSSLKNVHDVSTSLSSLVLFLIKELISSPASVNDAELLCETMRAVFFAPVEEMDKPEYDELHNIGQLCV